MAIVRTGKLNDAEKRRILRLVKEIAAQPPTRSQAEVDRELREIRDSRRKGWQRVTD